MSASRAAAAARLHPVPAVARRLSHLRASIDLRVRRPEDARTDRRAVSDLPQHHRRWAPRRASADRRADPLEIHEVPTGTQVFDWTVPKEWNIRDAYIKDADGRRVVDFRDNNLHVVNYSAPVNARMSLAELSAPSPFAPRAARLDSLSHHLLRGDLGLLPAHRQLESLAEGEYEVVIDSSLSDGALTYGECVLPGRASRTSS